MEVTDQAPPLVSVLMTAHNADAFIAQSIRSICHQTLRRLELIVVDDASTDGTAKLVERMASDDQRIRLLQPGRVGRTGALNHGLSVAASDWVAVLDADDLAMPNRLELQLEHLRAHPGVVMIGSDGVEVDARGVPSRTASYPTSHRRLLRRLERIGGFCAHSSVTFSRRAAEQIGGYRSVFKRSMDWDLFLRLAEIGRLHSLSTPLVKIRKLPVSLSTTDGGRLQLMMGTAATISHHLRCAGKHDPAAEGEASWTAFVSWVDLRLRETQIYDVWAWRASVARELKRSSSPFQKAVTLGFLPLTTAGRGVLMTRATGGTDWPKRFAAEWAKKSG